MVQHLTAVIIIGFVSLVVAMLVTPADPASMMVAVIPIFVMSVSAYWIGFRKGETPSNNDRIDGA